MVLVNPGEMKFKRVIAEVGDEIELDAWDNGTYKGTVESINDEEITIKEATLIWEVHPDIMDYSTIYTKNSFTFQNDEIYRVNVIKKGGISHG